MHEAMQHGTIIRREPENAANAASAPVRAFVVLVVRHDEVHLPFVVWYQRPADANGPAQYWSGAYCATLTEACEHFTRRTGVEA